MRFRLASLSRYKGKDACGLRGGDRGNSNDMHTHQELGHQPGPGRWRRRAAVTDGFQTQPGKAMRKLTKLTSEATPHLPSHQATIHQPLVSKTMVSSPARAANRTARQLGYIDDMVTASHHRLSLTSSPGYSVAVLDGSVLTRENFYGFSISSSRELPLGWVFLPDPPSKFEQRKEVSTISIPFLSPYLSMSRGR